MCMFPSLSSVIPSEQECTKCNMVQALTESNCFSERVGVQWSLKICVISVQECTKCNVVKPHTEFNRDKTKADGLQFRCKGCVHDYMRRRRRSEAGHKRRLVDAADRAIAADNLAVLAQVRRLCQSSDIVGDESWTCRQAFGESKCSTLNMLPDACFLVATKQTQWCHGAPMQAAEPGAPAATISAAAGAVAPVGQHGSEAAAAGAPGGVAASGQQQGQGAAGVSGDQVRSVRFAGCLFWSFKMSFRHLNQASKALTGL